MTNLELKTTLWDTEENWETYKNEILLDGQKVGEEWIGNAPEVDQGYGVYVIE